MVCTAQVGGTCKHWVAYSLETSEGFTRQSFNAVVSPRRAGFLLWAHMFVLVFLRPMH